MKTTLNEIRLFNPCKSGWRKLLKSMNITSFSESDGEREVTILQILESNGVKDAYWCLRIQKYEDICLILAEVAESVLKYYTDKYPNDTRVADCIQGIRDYKNGLINRKQLSRLSFAVYAAAGAAYADQWKKSEVILRKYIEISKKEVLK